MNNPRTYALWGSNIRNITTDKFASPQYLRLAPISFWTSRLYSTALVLVCRKRQQHVSTHQARIMLYCWHCRLYPTQNRTCPRKRYVPPVSSDSPKFVALLPQTYQEKSTVSSEKEPWSEKNPDMGQEVSNKILVVNKILEHIASESCLGYVLCFLCYM